MRQMQYGPLRVFFGSSIEGLSRGDVAPATAIKSGAILAPYVAHQVEAGVTVDAGMFGLTFSAFQSTRPIGELSPQRVFAQTGEQRVSRREFSVYGEITPQARILGGLALLDGVLTRTALAANVGQVPIGVPRVQLNFGAEWDLPGVPGLHPDRRRHRYRTPVRRYGQHRGAAGLGAPRSRPA